MTAPNLAVVDGAVIECTCSNCGAFCGEVPPPGCAPRASMPQPGQCRAAAPEVGEGGQGTWPKVNAACWCLAWQGRGQ